MSKVNTNAAWFSLEILLYIYNFKKDVCIKSHVYYALFNLIGMVEKKARSAKANSLFSSVT